MSCGAGMALQSCPQIGAESKAFGSLHQPVTGHISPCRGQNFWQAAQDSWGKHFSERMWTWRITCCIYVLQGVLGFSTPQFSPYLQLDRSKLGERCDFTSSLVCQINTMVMMHFWVRVSTELISSVTPVLHKATNAIVNYQRFPDHSKFWTTGI